jgi:hypothetical protein
MNIPESALPILTLFLLRLALPLIITPVFGHGMNRLVAHWNTNVDH